MLVASKLFLTGHVIDCVVFMIKGGLSQHPVLSNNAHSCKVGDAYSSYCTAHKISIM